MEVVLLFGGIVVGSVVVALLSARRMGVLVMSLAVGYILSSIWSEWLVELMSSRELGVDWLPVGILASVILLLAPFGLLLIGGPRYPGRFERVFSALIVGVMVVAFLVKPLGQYLSLSGSTLEFYELLLDWWQYIVSAGLIVAVIDVFIMHTRKRPAKK